MAKYQYNYGQLCQGSHRRLEEHKQGLRSWALRRLSAESLSGVETQQRRIIVPAGIGTLSAQYCSTVLGLVVLSIKGKSDRAGLMQRTPTETSLVCHVR